MCVKLPPGDLNPGPYLPYSINTYTYEMIVAPRMCGGFVACFLESFHTCKL